MRNIFFAILLAVCSVAYAQQEPLYTAKELEQKLENPDITGQWEYHYTAYNTKATDLLATNNLTFYFRKVGVVPNIENMIVELTADGKMKIGSLELLFSYLFSDGKMHISDSEGEVTVTMDYKLEDEIFLTLSSDTPDLFHSFLIKGADKKQAMPMTRDLGIAYYKWGNALFFAALQDENKDMYEASLAKYERSTELYRDDARAYIGWARALFNLGKLNDDKICFDAALAKIEEATQLDDSDAQAYSEWGGMLVYLADSSQNYKLYDVAIEKYEKATQMDEDYMEAYSSWGCILFMRARQLGSLNEDKTLIVEKLNKAYELSVETDNKIYLTAISAFLTNLYALLGEKDEAFEWLEKALESDKRIKGYLETDSDFDNLRQDPRFEQLLNKYSPKQEGEK